jgi:hypothetical protein
MTLSVEASFGVGTGVGYAFIVSNPATIDKALGRVCRAGRTPTPAPPDTHQRTKTRLRRVGAQEGKMQYGIYKLNGDRLTVCMTPRSGSAVDRSKDFTSKDSADVVFFFERVQEDKRR